MQRRLMVLLAAAAAAADQASLSAVVPGVLINGVDDFNSTGQLPAKRCCVGRRRKLLRNVSTPHAGQLAAKCGCGGVARNAFAHVLRCPLRLLASQ